MSDTKTLVVTLEEALLEVKPTVVFVVHEVEGEQTKEELIALHDPIDARIKGAVDGIEVKFTQGVMAVDKREGSDVEELKLVLLDPKKTAAFLKADFAIQVSASAITVVRNQLSEDLKVGAILA